MIGVVGLGFVGLTTALGFSHQGHKVFSFDPDRKRTRQIKNGSIPFHEPFLAESLGRYRDSLFIVCDSLEDVIRNCEIVFYCVGTPALSNGGADLTFLRKAVSDSLPFISADSFKVLVVKSTVPPPSTQDIIKPLLEKGDHIVGKSIGLASNPEFLREGFAWEDFTKPDRIVVGANDKRSGDIVAEAYGPFNAPIHRVSLNTAEFIKYLSNAMLSTFISFSNDMQMIADSIGGIDIAQSFNILHEDRRWAGDPAKMSSYVYPGCGFGGYCLPKDTAALHAMAQSKGYESLLLKDVLIINNMIKMHLVEKIATAMSALDRNIAILGLSFKPDSDDVRETPAADIIRMLLEKGHRNIIAYDPMATENFRSAFNLPIQYAASFGEIATEGDVFVVLTAWPDFQAQKDLLKGKKIIDGRFFLSL